MSPGGLSLSLNYLQIFIPFFFKSQLGFMPKGGLEFTVSWFLDQSLKQPDSMNADWWFYTDFDQLEVNFLHYSQKQTNKKTTNPSHPPQKRADIDILIHVLISDHEKHQTNCITESQKKLQHIFFLYYYVFFSENVKMTGNRRRDVGWIDYRQPDTVHRFCTKSSLQMKPV